MPGKIAALLVIFEAVLSAQVDVASIKPSLRMDTQRSANATPGGGFRATNYSLGNLIQAAFDVRSFEILGGPGWLDSLRYDVEAKPSEAIDLFGGGKEAQTRFRLMLQYLLADRFQLKVHRESKEMRVYFLVASKSGVKITRTADALGRATSMNNGRRQVNATQIDMATLAGELGGQLEIPVIDKTGLDGAYDIRLRWSEDTGPSIFTALEEQLGLKLEAGKAPVEILVVDSAEKASAN